MIIIAKGNSCKLLTGEWLYIHEVTWYLQTDKPAAIVTGDLSTFRSDAKTNVMRHVYSMDEFLDLKICEVVEEC